MVRFEDISSGKSPVAVVGLGYVGLPLVVAFAKHFKVVGFDISEKRVAALKAGHDDTGEVEDAGLAACTATFTSDPAELAGCGVVIVAVPTPIDGYRRPDLRAVTGASATVGRNMAKGAVVVYESTVYPGLTEEVCLPILEKESGGRLGVDFTLGYSPERINPGDKVHTLATIVKVVAGSDEDTARLLERLYGTVVTAGIHMASSIKVAEAAKVIENTQRDLNIALMNELSVIFSRLGIDTLEVLQAAGTKWNFLPFRPGLVGGHCIGVDPYYLTFKAEGMGYHPEVILAGRRINDSMAKHVAETCVKKLISQDKQVRGARVGVLGLTFKENVPDLRNSKTADLIAELKEYGVDVLVVDPMADPEEAMEEYGVTLTPFADLSRMDALILSVPHTEFKDLTPEGLRKLYAHPDAPLLLDVRACLDKTAFERAGYAFWRL